MNTRRVILHAVLALAACAPEPRREDAAPAAVDGEAELRQRLEAAPGATWDAAPETGVTR